MRSDKSLSDSKRLCGALGGDRCGFTQSTATTTLPYLMPKLKGEVLSARAWAKLYMQLGVAMMSDLAGGATYVNPANPGNNMQWQNPGAAQECQLLSSDTPAFGRFDVPLIPANYFQPGYPPVDIGVNPLLGQVATKAGSFKS